MNYGTTLLSLLVDRRLSVMKKEKLIFVEAPVGIKTWGKIDYMCNKHKFRAIRRYPVRGEFRWH